MEWCTVDEKYMDYLQTIEGKIPHTDYGKDSFKPFFAPLLEKDGLVYVTQISSAKTRHKSLKETADFKKIYDNRNNLIGVVNLNYMFPVPKDEIKYIGDYSNISNFRSFSSPLEESQYINLLKIELAEINNKNIGRAASNVYALKIQQPEHTISKRCLDFKLLEEKALGYILNKINGKLKELDNINKSDIRTKIYDELSNGNYSKKYKVLKEIEAKHTKSSDAWKTEYEKLENFKNKLISQDEIDKKVNTSFNNLKEARKTLELEKNEIKIIVPGMKDNYKKADKSNGLEK